MTDRFTTPFNLEYDCPIAFHFSRRSFLGEITACSLIGGAILILIGLFLASQ
jgi:hypothetical protein